LNPRPSPWRVEKAILGKGLINVPESSPFRMSQIRGSLQMHEPQQNWRETTLQIEPLEKLICSRSQSESRIRRARRNGGLDLFLVCCNSLLEFPLIFIKILYHRNLNPASRVAARLWRLPLTKSQMWADSNGSPCNVQRRPKTVTV